MNSQDKSVPVLSGRSDKKLSLREMQAQFSTQNLLSNPARARLSPAARFQKAVAAGSLNLDERADFRTQLAHRSALDDAARLEASAQTHLEFKK